MGQHKHDQLSKCEYFNPWERGCIIPGQETAWDACSPTTHPFQDLLPEPLERAQSLPLQHSAGSEGKRVGLQEEEKERKLLSVSSLYALRGNYIVLKHKSLSRTWRQKSSISYQNPKHFEWKLPYFLCFSFIFFFFLNYSLAI